MRKYNILTYALVVVLSLFIVVLAVQASSTIGTNMSTTGTLSVTGVASLSSNFEAVGYASASSVYTTTLQTSNGGTLTVNAFTLGGTVTGPLRLTGAASVSTIFEATTYASSAKVYTSTLQAGNGATLTINAFTLGGAITGGSNNATGIGQFGATGASISTGFEATSYASTSKVYANTVQTTTGGTLTINAFTLGGAITGGSNNITGVAGFGSLTASISTNFEASGYASASKLFVGGSAASSSTAYVAQFSSSSATASTSINFGGGLSTSGTCIQLKDSTGANVYLRVIGGATGAQATNLVSVTTKSCR